MTGPHNRQNQMKENQETESTAADARHSSHTSGSALQVIDLGSPFFFGVGRDMTTKERAEAERNGRHDNPPMSVLGVTDGIAAVEGKDLAHLFAAAPELLEVTVKMLRAFEYLAATKAAEDPVIIAARAAVAKASGQNDQSSNPHRERPSDAKQDF